MGLKTAVKTITSLRGIPPLLEIAIWLTIILVPVALLVVFVQLTLLLFIALLL